MDNICVREKAKQNHALLHDILSTAFTIAGAILIAFILKTFVIINADIPSGSMENTIMTGDHIIGNRLAYLFKDPARGDIVIFKAPDNPDEEFIKRIIGLPGETITIKDAKVYVDGVELKEDYLKPEEWTVAAGPYTFYVPENSYLVLGDNRNNSSDARYWNQSYVTRDAILAEAGFRYYPFNNMGFVD